MGRWRLERLLGSGGMAAVYLGRGEDGAARAIKVLHPQVARDKNLRARFAQEVDAVSRLAHASIVKVEDMGATDEGSPYIVMELLEGETLHDRLRRGLPSIDEALGLTDTLLDALAVAHDGRIIHRDIKPDNLFISANGLKILDFGIAKVRRDSMAEIKTETGTALGTPSYMAQEQIKGIDVDHRADLFAVGAVLFKMLAGRLVHDEPDPHRRLMKMLTTPAPPLFAVAPHLPEPVTMVVDRALAFEPEHRYPDARTMQADVRAVRMGQTPPYAAAAPPLSRGPTPPPAASGPPPTSQPMSDPTMATRVGPVTPAVAPVTPAVAAPIPTVTPALAASVTSSSWALPVVIVLSVLVGVLLVILIAL